jgi:creatinine amidohydrolase/Fe(II)-dependent formamide hydrolase-like protein
MLARALPLVLGLVLSASIAQAQAPRTLLLEDLTWTELRDRIVAGATTIIVPIGGTEQNGPHMTLGKHNARVKLLSEKIAAALGNALVAPVVAYVPEGGTSPPTSHMRFAGTITVPDAAFESMLESAGRSFRLHGFRDVVFLGDHGTYQNDLKAVAGRLNREWAATPVRAHAITDYYRVTETAYRAALASRGYRNDEIGTHAGLADTSLALAVDPRLVRTERLGAGTKLAASDGVYGDPHRASAELGQLGVDLIVGETVAAIRKSIAKR